MKRVAVFLLLCISVVSLGSCRSSTPAITVNGSDISMDDFERDLVGLASSDMLAQDPSSVVDGRATPDLTAKWANLVVVHELVRRENKHRGVTVTNADRDQAIAALGTDFTAFLDSLPKDLSDRFLDQQAQFIALENALGGESGAAAVADVQQRLVNTAKVRIDPRYGLDWAADAGGVVLVVRPGVRAGRGTLLDLQG